MAARSIFLNLVRKGFVKDRIRSGAFRSLSSSSTSEVAFEDDKERVLVDDTETESKDDLKSRIFSLRLPKRSATNVLQRWVGEGNQINISELRDISRELRKSRRFKHALEISEWMVGHEEYEISDSDYAVRIDLMSKVFGVDSAERYFEALPCTAKTIETYTALLHSYAAAKNVDKAEDLYQRMKEANLPLSALTYNELMTLYMSVGEVDKVASVVEDLKRQNVAPDLFTYNLWISSCAAALNIDEVKRILAEMSCRSNSSQDWTRYVNLANIYITSGHLVNSESKSLVENEKGITQREWITYDFLVILYAGLGNKDKLDQIWRSLRMTKQKMTGRNYLCILSSYLMLGHVKDVGEIIDQWKQDASIDFDSSICKRVLKAFAEIGMTDKAATFRLLLTEKGCDVSDEV